MEREAEVPNNSQMSPTLGTERAFEEQMKCGSFGVQGANGAL
jgi:hypothetical protein